MREIRDKSGRMPYRLWYDESEIDVLMEAELNKTGSPRRSGSLAVDIDAFIERHLGIVPDFVPLPAGVQGATEFFSNGSVKVKIAADLSERAEYDAGAEHLLRTTLAHESVHVLLHRILFLNASGTLFGGKDSRRELCRDVRFVASGYTGEWWEWQANRGMGALLLPRSEVVTAIRTWRNSHPPTEDIEDLERELSAAYGVSQQAVIYRLQQLNVASDPQQLELGF